MHEGVPCRQLIVARTPPRESLEFLASEGLVEFVAVRGAAVRKFTAKDVRDILDVLGVLGVLDAFVGRLARRGASDADIAEVRRLHDRMVERFDTRDRLEYFKRNQRIHALFPRLSGNASPAAPHAAIQSRLKRIRHIGNQEPRKWQDAMNEHDRMIRVLEARNGEALAFVPTPHMERTWERVRGTPE
jgi:DNA-binding GntR family transcriptional regulator